MLEVAFVYVLLLKDGKYFVGKAADVRGDIAKHMLGCYPQTKSNKPVRIVAVHLYETSLKSYLRAYRKKFGKENVDGCTNDGLDYSKGPKVDLQNIPMVCHICKEDDHSFQVCLDKQKSCTIL
jgi:predicted GIY-YIG superfamily endonuclease